MRELVLKTKLTVAARLSVFYVLFAWGASAQTNPVPLINQPLVPTAIVPGAPSFTLTVNGAGFVSASVVKWNGTALSTTLVKSSQLTATVPASNVATAGTASVTVTNPAPGGGTSNVEFFSVTGSASSPIFTNFVQTFASGSIGASGLGKPIAADFNGDGKLDLAVLGQTGLNDGIVIRLGNGDGSFQAPVAYAAPEGGVGGPVVGDFNEDGKLDLAIPDGSASKVSILLGNGDGSFQSEITSPTGSYTQLIVAADFNGDGNLDLATANVGTSPGLGSVSILLGKGDGTFQSHVDYAQGGMPAVLAAGDFNTDGKLDLAFLDFQSGMLSVLLGNGDGTFQPGQSIFVGRFAYDLIAVDLNGDGKLDLVALVADNSNAVQPSVLLGNGDGTFQPPVYYPMPGLTGLTPFGLTVADFNGDGKLDLATSSQCCSNNGNTDEVVSVFLGNGDGTFQLPLDFHTGVGNFSIVAGDFNEDGKMDVAGPLKMILLQGQFPSASLSPNSLTFASQAVGTTSPAQTVTLTNVGLITLALSNISVTGANARDFAQTNTCGPTLAIKANCQISVTFTPSSGGNPAASLSIADNALGSPQIVSLAGSTPPAPAASLSPSSIAFPVQYLGTSGLPQTVTVTNTGTAPLLISGVNTSAADFGTLNACGSSVAAGSSCAIGVFFDPTTTGSRTGTLTITDNTPGSPQTVTLSGTGQDFSLAPVSPASTTVTAGQTARFTVAVSPAGGFNQTVALTCNGGPSLSTCAVTPNSVGLNGTAAANVAVSVTTMAALPPLIISSPRKDYRLLYLLTELLVLSLLIGSLSWQRGRPRLAYGLALLVALSAGVAMSACGGGGSAGAGHLGTPAGTYTVVVSGTFTSGSTRLTHNTNLTLVVQ
jgi:hypothetical protein